MSNLPRHDSNESSSYGRDSYSREGGMPLLDGMGGYRDSSTNGDSVSVSVSRWPLLLVFDANFQLGCPAIPSRVRAQISHRCLLPSFARPGLLAQRTLPPFALQSPSSRRYTPSNSRGSTAGSVAPSISEKYNLPTDPTYWTVDDVEDDGSSSTFL
jgi:hypothetical protein